MMASQMLLPGFVRPPKRGWQPILHKVEKLKEYFRGYVANGREIYARIAHIAAKLGWSVRTVKRYLRYLRDSGWIATIRRTSRTAYRQVLQGPVPSAVPSLESPPITEVTPKSETSAALPSRILNAVHRAAARIRRAKNPAAYRQAIISCELRLLKTAKSAKPTNQPPTYQPNPRADLNALERFISWAGGNLDALRKPV